MRRLREDFTGNWSSLGRIEFRGREDSDCATVLSIYGHWA